MKTDAAGIVRARLVPLLQRMRAGEDVPPALWHRAEGALEALLAGGALDAQQLAALVEQEYTAALGQGTEAIFGEPAGAWISANAGVRLRFRMPRAPVYPTTAG